MTPSSRWQHRPERVLCIDIRGYAGKSLFWLKGTAFAEVIAVTSSTPTILSQQNLGTADLGAAMAKSLVEITNVKDTPLEDFLIMLNFASSKRASEIGRQQVENGHQRTLSMALKGELVPQRAALVLSLLAGFQMIRQMMALDALAHANDDGLIKIITPLFQKLINSPEPPTPAD